MRVISQLEENHYARSCFVRSLVQRYEYHTFAYSESATKPPKRIVQFWDDFKQLPKDVCSCIETWKIVETQGFETLLFDTYQAKDFIQRELGERHKRAFDKCYHPAMQSDYFRLCYIFVKGGCYIDVDDVYEDNNIQQFFNDNRLKIQPLCYDIATNKMVSPSVFTKHGTHETNWIFYFNNNPLIACSRHPLIECALTQATLSLERTKPHILPEIQSTTGPGNLTKSIFEAITENCELEKTLQVVCEWENIAINKWDLSYRNDQRNWRLSNCREYQRTIYQKIENN